MDGVFIGEKRVLLNKEYKRNYWNFDFRIKIRNGMKCINVQYGQPLERYKTFYHSQIVNVSLSWLIQSQIKVKRKSLRK